MSVAYLSLGSNVGDRRRNLLDALRSLAADDLAVRRVSSIYETEPRELPDQPWFLNLVAEVETALSPAGLLERCLHTERTMGRIRQVPKGPRAIDIDVLLYDDLVVKAPGLAVPHPRMAERRFVLEPLTELAPERKHPILGRTIRELLAATLDQAVARAEPE
ncbi:MAG: 2-amino-4-hydroxy-6-hydroxymethyldihydropteridine diphosphokinase [Bryobacteraceae bacterium]|nr:2-amino-4-hydroxy-6-hydroxymethyldihydropteridine diphosphokinase [Bryobacteraceae bacterium]